MGVKLCLSDGCWNVTTGSYCADCERRRQAQRNAQPKRKAYKAKAYTAVPLDGTCACCGATEDLTRDHVVPLVFDGVGYARHGGARVVIMCRGCNSSKGARRMTDHRCPRHGGQIAEIP